MTVFLSALAKPFILFLWLAFCLLLVEGIRRFFPDCKLKRLLLFKLWD